MSEIKILEQQRYEINDKINQLRNNEREESYRGVVGKCFVYRGNCYSLPETPSDYWDEFYYIKSLKDGNPFAIKLSVDSNDKIEVVTDYEIYYFCTKNLQEVNESEFMDKYKEIVSSLDDVKKLLSTNKGADQ